MLIFAQPDKSTHQLNQEDFPVTKINFKKFEKSVVLSKETTLRSKHFKLRLFSDDKKASVVQLLAAYCQSSTCNRNAWAALEFLHHFPVTLSP